jgi:hypothetical protein
MVSFLVAFCLFCVQTSLSIVQPCTNYADIRICMCFWRKTTGKLTICHCQVLSKPIMKAVQASLQWKFL